MCYLNRTYRVLPTIFAHEPCDYRLIGYSCDQDWDGVPYTADEADDSCWALSVGGSLPLRCRCLQASVFRGVDSNFAPGPARVRDGHVEKGVAMRALLINYNLSSPFSWRSRSRPHSLLSLMRLGRLSRRCWFWASAPRSWSITYVRIMGDVDDDVAITPAFQNQFAQSS